MRTRPSGTPENQALGRLVRRARKQAGVSQVQLAARLGQPQSFVSKVERGERHLEVVVFLDVARILGRDPFELLREYVDGAGENEEE